MLRNYNLTVFKSDLTAGITVGIVAVPLALAFAIASGVDPVKGFYTAIVGGFIISLAGGSKYQIGGPTGAFVVIVYGVISQYGYDGLVIATIIAGLLLIAFGLARIGSFIKFIPYPVTTGFTAGIGVVILTSQINDLLGLGIESLPPEFTGKWAAFCSNISSVDPVTLSVGASTVAVIFLVRTFAPQIPAHVFSIIFITFIVWLFGINVETIGSRFGEIPSDLPSFHMPEWSYDKIRAVFPSAVTIALLAGIESLLSAVVADGMTGGRHNSNRELVGQGLANIAVGFFGGIPATGAIARTATNVRAGGKTGVSGMIHAVFLALFMLFFSGLVEIVPMAALAGVLTVVSLDMMDLRRFRRLMKSPVSDIAVLLITFALTVIIDLTVAVQVGVVLAALLFMKRMSDVTSVGKLNLDVAEANGYDAADPDAISKKTVPAGVEVYEINGPFFFGVADLLINTLEYMSKAPKVFILRMRNVPAVDATGVHALENFYAACSKRGTALVLSGVNPGPYKALLKMGVIASIGADNVTDHIDKALARASVLLENTPAGNK